MALDGKDKDYILYIGNYLDENIVSERGLPTRNPAGSNRMLRLASSLQSSNKSTVIISPGISVRNKYRKLFHAKKVSHCGTVPIVYSPAVGIPFIEVHLSNIHAREEFRRKSFFSDIAVGVISGLGPVGYELALTAAIRYLENG